MMSVKCWLTHKFQGGLATFQVTGTCQPAAIAGAIILVHV